MEFKLCLYSNQTEVVTREFSRLASVSKWTIIIACMLQILNCYWLIFIADLEKEMKEMFSVARDAVCKIWYRYTTNHCDLVTKHAKTLQEAGLKNGMVSLCMMKY